MKTKLTPTPFRFYLNANGTRHHIATVATDRHGRSPLVATMEGDTLKDQSALAAFLVRACNSHDELLAALLEIVDHATKYGAAPLSATKMFDRARSAIARAEGRGEE